MFKPNALYYVDGYKVGHKAMLAPGTTRLFGTEIPRSLKYGPKGATKVVNFGKKLVWRWIHDQFEENFFFTKEREHNLNYQMSGGVQMSQQYDINVLKEKAQQFGKDMSMYLGLPYDAKHFDDLWELGYLPVSVRSLPEWAEVDPNVVTSGFINTVDGYAWLTLYLETIASALTWKPMLSATIAKQYRKNCKEWVMKTDPANAWLIDFMCHDFSARGLNPHDMVSVGLGHATSFRGSDTLIAIPAARYYYGESDDTVIINSVNASEHSVTCTGIFYYQSLLKTEEGKKHIEKYYSFDAPCEGSVENPDYLAIAEWLNLKRWLELFRVGILSVVSDTFDLWKLITFILPRLKDEILSREGKLVIRPDSGDPVDIICGTSGKLGVTTDSPLATPQEKGVIELLWGIFGGNVNEQGYKTLDSHIGAIYGDSITLDRQVEIYKRLEAKGFATTNIVLGVGSYTYAYNTRDSIGLAYKGAWFEVEENDGEETYPKSYNIYKDPVTDDGTKKSLKGFQFVYKDENGEYKVESEVSEEKYLSDENELKLIYEDGVFYNQVTFEEIRKNLQQTL